MFGGVYYLAIWATAEGYDSPFWHGKVCRAQCARLSSITIIAGKGHDIVNLSGMKSGDDAPWNTLQNVARPIIVQGGPGNDLIIGSQFIDVLDGGEGTNQIQAGEDDIVSNGG